MVMPTCYSTLFDEILRKQQKYLPDIGLSRQKIDKAQYKQIFFVGWYIHIFHGYKLNYFS